MLKEKDVKMGNIPAFTKTEEFRKIFPIGRNKLMQACGMPNAPIIHNGRVFIIKTAQMIDFIEKINQGM